MSRIKWERAKALIQQHYAFNERPNDWPQRFAPVHLAHLQAPPIGKDRSHTTVWQTAIESAAGAGELPNVLQSFTLDPPFSSASYADAISAGMEGRKYAPEPVRPLVNTWPGIVAGDFQTWLKSQGETASEHIAAWFDARCTAPAQTAAPVVADQTVTTASDAPAKRNRKPSWATVAMPYMKALFKSGQYKSATVFYEALKRRAAESDSPFKLVNRELYCTDAGTTVSRGALGNVWPEIREQ